MPTLSEMVDETLLGLHGYGVDAEALTVLTAEADASTLTLTVDDARQVSKGIVEVGDELMWIKTVDSTGNTLRVLPGTRGHKGTVAAVHPAGTLVSASPRVPRQAVANALNDVIEQTWPTLSAVGTLSVTASGSVAVYVLPDDTLAVLDVEWQPAGPSQEWLPVRGWRFSPSATLPTVTLLDGVAPGRPLRVIYQKAPVRITAGQDFTLSGLPATARDLVEYGACARLVGFLEPGRLGTQAVSTVTQSGESPAGAATAAAKWFYNLYQRRLEEERNALLTRYPIRLHRSR